MPPSRRTLYMRFFLLEAGPLVGALAYSVYHPRQVVIALSVYALAALVNVALSIRDGVVLEWYGNVCNRKEEKIGFWVSIFVYQAAFPLVFLFIAIASIATGTLVWPP